MKFNYETYHSIYVREFRNVLVTLGLFGALYGVLTVLSVLSVRALTQRSSRRTRPTVIVLCLTIITLFASTTIDMVTYILSTQSTLLSFVIGSGLLLWFPSNEPIWLAPASGTISNYFPLQNCASTAALTINITLGDAIVCWRACVIWNKNRVVRGLCGIFLLATFALGLADTFQGCQPAALGGPTAMSPIITTKIGALYEGVPVGIAACVLSLSTNLMATILVAYKACQSRRRFKGYLMAGGSHVGKLLALLIESGAVYCAIWVVIVAFQVAEYEWEVRVETSHPGGLASAGGRSFLDIFNIVCNGALVPIIAIYPTIIIVLVALDKSHIEKGLSQHIESLPTPRVVFTANADVTSELSTQHRRESEVLVTGLDEQSPECANGVDDASMHGTSKERKFEEPLV